MQLTILVNCNCVIYYNIPDILYKLSRWTLIDFLVQSHSTHKWSWSEDDLTINDDQCSPGYSCTAKSRVHLWWWKYISNGNIAHSIYYILPRIINYRFPWLTVHIPCHNKHFPRSFNFILYIRLSLIYIFYTYYITQITQKFSPNINKVIKNMSAGFEIVQCHPTTFRTISFKLVILQTVNIFMLLKVNSKTMKLILKRFNMSNWHSSQEIKIISILSIPFKTIVNYLKLYIFYFNLEVEKKGF